MNNGFYIFEVHFIFKQRKSLAITFVVDLPYSIFAPLLLGQIENQERCVIGPMVFPRDELTATLFIPKGTKTA